ncbi:MAG: hypothetical protein ACRDQX_00935 [Pseudonocardiaceae bacterium]
MDRTEQAESQAAPHRKPDTAATELAWRFRTVTARWILATPEEGKEIHAVLEVVHHGNPSYLYRATVRQSTVEYRPFGRVETFALLTSSLVLVDVPAKRFSRAGLAAAFAGALTELRKRADEPGIAASFVVSAARIQRGHSDGPMVG